MLINKEFINRQQLLLQQIGPKGIAIVFAAKEQQRNGDTVYPYHQDSDFYYLTGFTEPEAIAVFIPERKEGEYILFCREKDPQIELWVGNIVGLEAACKDYGASEAFPINQAKTMLSELIKGREQIYSNRFINWADDIKGQERAGINAPTDFFAIGKLTHEMRTQKDKYEISLLRKAAQITAATIRKVMQASQIGMKEHELEAVVLHEFTHQGARFTSFETIIAAGANSCILHHPADTTEIKDGDLVLIDIGAEYQGYTGDITRTFPANGRFTAEQRAIYQAVLDTQLAVIAMIRPGLSWIDLQYLARRIITKNLLKLELLTGELDNLITTEAYKPFYPHHIGHWLGLDAHDVGKYKINDHWRPLTPGMVLTIEPGIYIPANMPNVDPKWWNIGVRIEDDILVTEDGHEILSTDVPKTIVEIEEISVGK